MANSWISACCHFEASQKKNKVVTFYYKVKHLTELYMLVFIAQISLVTSVLKLL